jgi:hypothetical protein
VLGKLRDKLTTRRALVVIFAVLLALAWAVPSIGASTAKLARLALGRANTAVHDSNLAIDTSNTAKGTANSANATANSANSTANSAKTTANQAQTTANQALTKANSIVTASYARMNQPCNTDSTCSIDHVKGVSSIRQTSVEGNYCVTATGRSPSGLAAASWLASVDAGDVGGPTAPQAFPYTNLLDCTTSEFGVQITVGSGNANQVSFFVVIP